MTKIITFEDRAQVLNYFSSMEIQRIASAEVSKYHQETRFVRVSELSFPKEQDREQLSERMSTVLSAFRGCQYGLAYILLGNASQIDLLLGISRQYGDEQVPPEDAAALLASTLRACFPGVCVSVLPETENKHLIESLLRYRYYSSIAGVPSVNLQQVMKNDPHSASKLSRPVRDLGIIANALEGHEYMLAVLSSPLTAKDLIPSIQEVSDLISGIHHLTKKTVSEEESHQKQESVTISKTDTKSGSIIIASYSRAKGRSTTEGTLDSKGKSFSWEVKNRAIEYLEEIYEAQLERMKLASGSGAWRVSVIVGSKKQSVQKMMESVVQGYLSGPESSVQPFCATSIPEDIAREYLICGKPLVPVEDQVEQSIGAHWAHGSLNTLLTTQELAVAVALPMEETWGIRSREIAWFGLNQGDETGIALGNLMNKVHSTDRPVRITPERFSSHTFITGVTGSGKTNTALGLLSNFHKEGIPFLVIEPAKSEYRKGTLSYGKDLRVFTLGSENIAPFRMNPFEFPEGIEVVSHIDRLKAVFNAAFPMYAAMPYILESCLYQIYEDLGWDLPLSCWRQGRARRKYPTLTDLYMKIDHVVSALGYHTELTMNYAAALKARIDSLRRGAKGQMLNSQNPFPFDQLLSKPTLLELKYIGDDEEKAFLMGVLLSRLYEEREHQGHSNKLRHVTVVEEAHRLFRATPLDTSQEVANNRGKAVETFSNLLAELRAYGEGLVIIDQIPSKMVPDVIKNTDVKIIHRLPSLDDREAVGHSIALNEERIRELALLPTGRAVVSCGGWDRASCVEIPLQNHSKHVSDEEIRSRFLSLCTSVPELSIRALEMLPRDRRAIIEHIWDLLGGKPGPLCQSWEDAERLFGNESEKIANILIDQMESVKPDITLVGALKDLCVALSKRQSVTYATARFQYIRAGL